MTRAQRVDAFALQVAKAYLSDVINNGPYDLTQFTDEVLSNNQLSTHELTLAVDKAALKLLSKALAKVAL